MKHLLNMLGAIVFGLVLSVEYVGAKSIDQPSASVGNISPMLSGICVNNPNISAEQCVKGIVQMMKFARAVGRSETSCAIIQSNEFEVQDRCEEFDKDPDVQDLYNWIGK